MTSRVLLRLRRIDIINNYKIYLLEELLRFGPTHLLFLEKLSASTTLEGHYSWDLWSLFLLKLTFLFMGVGQKTISTWTWSNMITPVSFVLKSGGSLTLLGGVSQRDSCRIRGSVRKPTGGGTGRETRGDWRWNHIRLFLLGRKDTDRCHENVPNETTMKDKR